MVVWQPHPQHQRHTGRHRHTNIATQTNYAIQGSTNRIDSTTTGSNGALTSTYLPTGQLVSDGVRTYSYDNAGRSSTISQNSISMSNLYDGLGQRVRKSSSNVPTNFMYDEQGHLIGEYDQNNAMVREYIWLGDRIIGMYSKDAPNILLRVHTDHLGTPRAVTMEDGSNRRVLWRFEGDAFGDVQPTNLTSAAFTMPLRMAGQYFDSEVGISYNYFRDYDSSTGRYVESDPIGLKAGTNTYGYVGGDPLVLFDPTGEGAVGATIGGRVGGAAAGALGFESGPLDLLAIATGTKIGSAIGSAVEDACTNGKCRECKPYKKGTIGYTRLDYGHTHFPAGDPHYLVVQVNQSPSCKCFWNKANPDSADPPLDPSWVDVTKGLPPLWN